MHSENAPEDKGLPDTNRSANEMQIAHLSDSATVQQREDCLKDEVTHEGTFTSTLESNGCSMTSEWISLSEPPKQRTLITLETLCIKLLQVRILCLITVELVDDSTVESLEEVQFAIAQPPNMTSSNQESITTRAPHISANYSPMQSPSSDSPHNSVQPQGTSSKLRTFVSLSTSSPETLSSPDVLQVEESRTKSDSGRSSPYLLINKDSMADALKFETSLLLYA